MTFLNESRSNKGLGFPILQHHNRADTPAGDQLYGKDGRHGVFAARVFGRMLPERLGGTIMDPDGFTGPYICDPDSFGDLIGSFLWNHSTGSEDSGNPAGPTGERGFPGWRWSWPVVKVRKPEKGDKVDDDRNLLGAELVGPVAKIDKGLPGVPIFDEDGVVDFNPVGWGGDEAKISPPKPVEFDKDGFIKCPKLEDHLWQPTKGGAWQDIDFAQKKLYTPYPGLKFPIGHVGMGVSGTYEWAQDETYLPTDPRLFAVNNISDTHMSTQVCDVTDEFTIDHERKAKLHSFFRVIDNGPFCPEIGNICGDMKQKTLAWNITTSGCEDAYGGWVVDGLKYIAAAVEYDGLGGPFHVGNRHDKHDLEGHEVIDPRKTIVGEPDKRRTVFNPLHIHINALYTDSAGKMDGPKHHAGFYKGGEEYGHNAKVFLEYDPEAEDLGRHPSPCGPQKGWHRWRASVPYNTHNPPETPPTTSESGYTHADGGGASVGLDTLAFVPIPRDDRGWQPAVEWADGAGPDTSPGDEPSNGGTPTTGKQGSPGQYTLQNRSIPVAGSGNKCYTYFNLETAHPGLIFKPQHFAEQSIDYRNWFSPTEEAVKSDKEYTPAVARLEAFGHQDTGAHKGPTCPGWSYTTGTEPDGTHKGRYQCKTADGGIMFMPPEYGVENYTDVVDDPATQSTSTFLMAPNTKLAFGLPDLATGKLSTAAHEDSNGGFSMYVHTDGTLRVDTADGVNAFYVKESGNVVITGAVDSVPSITSAGKGSFGGQTAATGGVKGLEVEATNRLKGGYLESAGSISAATVMTLGSATALSPPSNVTEAIAFNGAGSSGSVGGISSGQAFLYTVDAGYGVLDLYYKNYSGAVVKLN